MTRYINSFKVANKHVVLTTYNAYGTSREFWSFPTADLADYDLSSLIGKELHCKAKPTLDVRATYIVLTSVADFVKAYDLKKATVKLNANSSKEFDI